MQQVKRTIIFAAVLLTPTLTSGQAFAVPSPKSSQAAVQELKVTAVVPAHRDIIVDLTGGIMRITSNTPDDVQPNVYVMEISPRNQQELDTGLYAQYRRHVPEGTAKYGVLYERNTRTAVLSRLFMNKPDANS